MANINIKVEPTIQTISQLSKGIKKDGSKILAGRALARASIISTEIGNMLVNRFNNTDVAKSLMGHGPADLPAHFGLDDITARSLADGMANLIKSSINLLTVNEGGIISIKIRAIEDNWGEYLNLPGAQYVSRPSNITIPVARWLLIDPSIDIGQAAYDIVFEGEDEKFDARIQKFSRSGRAIMVSLEVLGGSGGYVLPDIVSGRAGQNFIEYTLGQPDVAKEAAIILMKKVK